MKITKEEKKLLLICGLMILLVDIILMKFWVFLIKPNPLMSIGPQYYRPKIYVINIVVGVFVFFFKKRLSILFFLNTIVCALIFTFFWHSYMDNHPFSMSRYSFTQDEKTYILHIEKNPDNYSISEIKSENIDSLLWDRNTSYYAKTGDRLEFISQEWDYNTINDSLFRGYTRFYTKRCDSLEIRDSSREYDSIMATVSWALSYHEKKGDSLRLISYYWKYDSINNRREQIDTMMYFFENKLIGFPKSPHDILVKKIDGF